MKRINCHVFLMGEEEVKMTCHRYRSKLCLRQKGQAVRGLKWEMAWAHGPGERERGTKGETCFSPLEEVEKGGLAFLCY